MTKLILASQSPARLDILKNAGFHPTVEASEVDEDQVMKAADAPNIDMYVKTLAAAKARDVADRTTEADALILGADSALEFEGQILGKPHKTDVALERWKKMRGKQGKLFTGQSLIDNKSGAQVTESSFTTVWFSDISDLQIERYVRSGEPLKVAGAFTIDSLGGAFIERIEGDYHTVVGLSLRILREMMDKIGYEYTDFWK